MKRSSSMLVTILLMLGAILTTSCGSGSKESPKPEGSASELPSTSEREQWVRASGAATQIHQLTEMNTRQLRALPRERTVVVLSGSYIGQHGPYLPCVDCFRNERLARELAHAIAQKPDWHVLVFPFIPLGQGSIEEFGGRPGLHPAFVVRAETLRSIFMDLASHFGEHGFRWVFVIHSHGAPYHLQALDQAGDYYHDTYGGHMVHLTGLVGLDQLDNAAHALMSDAERKEDGLGVHANMIETSEALYLRPDLVSPRIRKLPPGHCEARRT